MGTWSTEIGGNDTYGDIYDGFYEFYNEGMKPKAAAKKMREEYAEYFEEAYDRHDSLFALAMALWETDKVDSQLLDEIKHIIERGDNLKLCKDQEASAEDLEERKKELDKFLAKISSPNPDKKQDGKPNIFKRFFGRS